MRTFNQRALEIISLVAEYGSVTAAAKALGATQSFVSKQVVRLEDEWGDRLFERTGRGMRLSNFGQEVMPEIIELLAQAGRLEACIRDNSGVPAGNVRVGVVPSMSRQLLPRLFADIQKRAPAVRLLVVEGFTGALEKQLAAGDLDLAVMNRYNSESAGGEDTLGQVETMLIGKPGAYVLSGKEVDFSKLDMLPLVVPPWPDGLRVFLDREAKARKLKLNIRLEVNTISALTRIAASGDAFTFLPAVAVLDDINSGRLAVSKIVNPAMVRTIALGLSQRHPLSRAARLVALRVREMMAELLAA